MTCLTMIHSCIGQVMSGTLTYNKALQVKPLPAADRRLFKGHECLSGLAI